MSWTYSGDPSQSTLDEVRFLIGDTCPCDQLLQDEEIKYLIASEVDIVSAAVKGAETIAAKFSRLSDESVGQVSVRYSQKSEQYWKLSLKLKSDAALSCIPYCGGISKSDKETQELDDDRVKPKFTKELHDFDELTDDNIDEEN